MLWGAIFLVSTSEEAEIIMSAALSLELKDVGFSYGKQTILKNLNIAVHKGESIGLIGPNGSGKSTLLNLICGTLKPETGNLYIDGVDIQELSPKNRALRVSMVPQIPTIPEGFTVLDVVLMGRNPHLGLLENERLSDIEICRTAMRSTSILPFSDRMLTSLSGGEKQRTFISRTLAQESELVLLDEPTANLDMQHQFHVIGIIREIVESGITTISAIHDLSLASRFCQRLVLLYEGEILSDGVPADVITSDNIAKAFGVIAKVENDSEKDFLTVEIIGPIPRFQ